jgi:hypothetical protein
VGDTRGLSNWAGHSARDSLWCPYGTVAYTCGYAYERKVIREDAGTDGAELGNRNGLGIEHEPGLQDRCCRIAPKSTRCNGPRVPGGAGEVRQRHGRSGVRSGRMREKLNAVPKEYWQKPVGRRRGVEPRERGQEGPAQAAGVVPARRQHLPSDARGGPRDHRDRAFRRRRQESSAALRVLMEATGRA